jgi:hypothetical protein
MLRARGTGGLVDEYDVGRRKSLVDDVSVADLEVSALKINTGEA